ncbi:hypothetical protein GTA08_BOTSDO06016 [Botryosphaeria dothidea]|uniref:Uncharacterized protein n=1 Tax=Botryosphaeria dothidea TaxID=55169 RepID=A0A8H4IV55_9PEZI|nr:hypothetical protein GTA08_BOTSDO06016 [Botryosphaeria dothidea]
MASRDSQQGQQSPQTPHTSSHQHQQKVLSNDLSSNTSNGSVQPDFTNKHEDYGQGYSSSKTYACPYHGSVLQMQANTGGSTPGMSPVDRFLVEGPGQQHALFVRPDNGQLSTFKRCTCEKVE